jgi:hypothetical protein
MRREVVKTGAMVIATAVAVMGCVSTLNASGLVTNSRCKLGYHTESFPENSDPKKAYKCRSDDEGYLRGLGDEKSMRPLP